MWLGMAQPSSWLLLAFKQLVGFMIIFVLFSTHAKNQSIGGKAYGFFSLEITFLLAIFLFEVGSLICGVAPTSVALIIGRAIAGLGAAGLNTGSFTLAAFCAPPHKRPIFTGLIGLSYGELQIGTCRFHRAR